MFYNTASLSGDHLRKRRKTASSQEQIILDFINANPQRDFTPCELKPLLEREHPLREWLLTTVRRVCTDLKNQNDMQVTGKRMGKYGIEVFTYKSKVKVEPKQTELKLAS